MLEQHFLGKSYAASLTKNGLGKMLGDFFTNSSGHPAYRATLMLRKALIDIFDYLEIFVFSMFPFCRVHFNLRSRVTRLGYCVTVYFG
jgi:hypothetical protein